MLDLMMLLGILLGAVFIGYSYARRPLRGVNVRRVGQVLLVLGAVMLAAGFTLPFIIGTLMPPGGDNVLRIGGIVLAVTGFVVRVRGERDKQ